MEHIYQGETFGPDYFTFPSLYAEVVRRAPDGAVFVELGSYYGKSTAFLAVEIINSGKKITLNSIDSWSFEADPTYLNYKNESGDNGEDVYQKYLKNMKPLKKVVKTIRSVSWDAAALFENASVDFLFIDADHSFDAVVKDLVTWIPKVKRGGVIAGHDYFTPSVQSAVHAAFGIDSIFVAEGCWIRQL